MADIIRALTEAIEKIGLVAVLTVIIVVAAGYVVIWNKRLIEMMQQFSERTVKANTDAMLDNTAKLDEAAKSNHDIGNKIAETTSTLKSLVEQQKDICKAGVRHCEAHEAVHKLVKENHG